MREQLLKIRIPGDRLAQADLARMGSELITLVREETISSMLTEVVAFEEIPGSLVKLSQRQVRGKLVARL